MKSSCTFVGLAHDYAKEIPVDKQQALANRTSEIISPWKVLKSYTNRWAYLISNLCGVKDEALLDAIRERHGGELWVYLRSQCLFVADAIEGRKSYQVSMLQKIAAKNIDDAVFIYWSIHWNFYWKKEVSIFQKQ